MFVLFPYIPNELKKLFDTRCSLFLFNNQRLNHLKQCNHSSFQLAKGQYVLMTVLVTFRAEVNRLFRTHGLYGKMFLSSSSKENTWTQHLSKGQYVGRSKVIKNPLIRESQAWLANRFKDFDYTNDAIFESFRDYPSKKQLYRKHKDIAKDYDRKVRFYKSCQRWYSNETKRQMVDVEERFSKLLQYTFDSNSKKTKGLQQSYSKWISVHGKTIDHDKSGDVTLNSNASKTNILPDNANSPIPTVSRADRVHSLRSVSVDNIPKIVEDIHISEGHNITGRSLDLKPGITKSNSSLDIRHTDEEMTRKLSKIGKHAVKLSSH